MTGAADVLYLVDVLSGFTGSAIDPRACDIDRNDVCDDADKDRLFDLLHGVNTTRAWLNVALPPKPTTSGPNS